MSDIDILAGETCQLCGCLATHYYGGLIVCCGCHCKEPGGGLITAEQARELHIVALGKKLAAAVLNDCDQATFPELRRLAHKITQLAPPREEETDPLDFFS